MNNKLYCLAAALSMAVATASAQTDDGGKFYLRGSVQSDVLIPQEDIKIGTGTYSDWGLTNTYGELHLLNKYVQAGARIEYLDHPLPGFEQDFKGWGVPYVYIKGSYKGFELTGGNFYDQFGSGLIFRTYEERSLGIDNSLMGGRLAINAIKGMRIKLLAGKQRRYWDYNDSRVYGGDVEVSVDQWAKSLRESNTYLTIGASAVSKHEGNEDLIVFNPSGMSNGAYKLNLPNNVAAFDVRANLQKGNYNFLAEYARKSQDPSFDNGYIYHNGSALLLSGSYSKRGMSVLLQAKRSEDMGYRSERSVKGLSSYINHLPAFTQQQTYALAALYPYATQNSKGEWAFQAELGYNFKRRTALGGKYGTNVKFNFSHVRSIDKTPVAGGGDTKGTEGYSSKFFKMGDEVYYQDFNVQLEKKLSKHFKLNAMYMHQRYNQTVVEGHGGTVRSHIGILEGKWTVSDKVTLRGEAQYLHTEQDQKDWWFGLIEVSVLPNFMFTFSDQYNGHVPTFNANGSQVEGPTNKVHYLMGSVAYTHKAHRLQLGYGRTRAGYNCSGGVCRYVPASKGFTASYVFNF